MGFFSNPAPPPLTEKNIPDQSGKVFIITGSTAGVGKCLASILYQQNAKIYVAARSESKAESTIQEFKTQYPQSTGSLCFLNLDLNDLTGIKASAEEFLRQETRLDVLWNNAGVMRPPEGSVTKQDYELQIGVNNLAPFLFTKLLTPLLVETAKTAPEDSVRVVWVSSSAVENFAPKGGVELNGMDYRKDKMAWRKYGRSKAGNVFHSKVYARRYSKDGIISISCDPGNLKTDLYQHMPRWQSALVGLVLHQPIWGAYTELFCGLSDTISVKDNGAFVQPWGRIGPLRKDIEEACKSKAEGGTGKAEAFWEWSEEQVRPYI